jgi:hypothetical protein
LWEPLQTQQQRDPTFTDKWNELTHNKSTTMQEMLKLRSSVKIKSDDKSTNHKSHIQ